MEAKTIDISPKPFILSHVALYTKNWYKRSGDIFADLKKCLEADGYNPFTNTDIIQIIIRNTIPVVQECRKHWSTSDIMLDFLDNISEHNCWKVGFYTKDHNWYAAGETKEDRPDYNLLTASMYYYMSFIQGADKNKLGDGLLRPSNDVLPLSSDNSSNFKWFEDEYPEYVK